jgi:hypothetical protein
MYREWDFEVKTRPSPDQIAQLMEILLSRSSEIVGKEVDSSKRPLGFTGKKARRLLVLADPTVTPPWGGWSHLSTQKLERRTFTHFRAEINRAIPPHEVDHIEFIEDAERNASWDSPSCTVNLFSSKNTLGRGFFMLHLVPTLLRGNAYFPCQSGQRSSQPCFWPMKNCCCHPPLPAACPRRSGGNENEV